jgi:hypothetical protein
MALSFSQAKQIPITEYLSGIGLEPSKIRGNDYWYFSPFRHERSPSLKVNTKFNVWYDHGSGEGGTLIDLGAKLHQCSLHEFLEKLSVGNFTSQTVPFQRNPFEAVDRKLEISTTRDLCNSDLVHYLESRGIKPHFAREYCRETAFSIGAKSYLAVGFPNRSGGFELRNRWFKGSSSPKDVSLIDNGSSHLCVMEGFMDFLSLLTLNQKRIIELPLRTSFLILNSISFLNKNLTLLRSHQDVRLFLDNDLAGKEAKQALTLKGISFQDASTLYAGHKDVNDFLKSTKGGDATLTRSRGLRP